MLNTHYAAIDPMALILSEKAYLIWVELHHPHTPDVATIEQVFERLSPEERMVATAKAAELAAYGKAVEAASARYH